MTAAVRADGRCASATSGRSAWVAASPVIVAGGTVASQDRRHSGPSEASVLPLVAR